MGQLNQKKLCVQYAKAMADVLQAKFHMLRKDDYGKTTRELMDVFFWAAEMASRSVTAGKGHTGSTKCALDAHKTSFIISKCFPIVHGLQVCRDQQSLVICCSTAPWNVHVRENCQLFAELSLIRTFSAQVESTVIRQEAKDFVQGVQCLLWHNSSVVLFTQQQTDDIIM